MRHFRSVWLIVAAVVASAAAAQQPGNPSGKIAFVNSARVMEESGAARKAKQALEDKYAKLAREIEAGPKERIESRMAALNDEMNAEREDALRQFVERSNRVIRGVAMAENLDIVFHEAIYAGTRIDITDKVIKELDAER